MKDRVIKFRAWDKSKEFMHEPQDYIFNGMWHGGRKSATGDLVVMQFTGLRDCNGKEIYEGDLVNIHASSGSRKDGYHLICWSDEECSWAFKEGVGYWRRPTESLWPWIKNKELTVIGNMFENPELMD